MPVNTDRTMIKFLLQYRRDTIAEVLLLRAESQRSTIGGVKSGQTKIIEHFAY